MEFKDRLLTCIDCGCEFIFTAGEQLFFYDKQFKNDPKRCKPCKSKRAGMGTKAAVEGGTPVVSVRTETRTHCSTCGVETTVPFKPTQGRPVLCRQCFKDRQSLSAARIPQSEPAVTAPTADLIANATQSDHVVTTVIDMGAISPQI